MRAHLDYLRLASWDVLSYPLLMSDLMEAWPGDWEDGGWLQYKGWRKGEFFIGHGEQNNKRHAICHVSGGQAQKMMSGFLSRRTWYCTRIDVQVTIPKPTVDLAKLHTHLGTKKTTLISSEENMTLYIGKRTSDVFTRLYEKPLDKMYLRLEFEIKGGLAKSVWEALCAGRQVDEIFEYYLDKSILPDYVKSHFQTAGANDTDLHLVAETLHNAEKRLAWLQSLDNSVMMAITDHDIGERVKMLVMSWANYAANLDRISDSD